MTCAAPITEKATKQLFERLVAAKGAEPCELEEVSTEQTRMTVQWKSGGQLLPAAEIVRKECAQPDAVVGATLAISVPEPLRAACPATVAAAVGVVQRETFDAPPIGGSPGHAFPWRPVAIGAVAVVAAAIIVWLELRRRRRRPAAPPDTPA